MLQDDGRLESISHALVMFRRKGPDANPGHGRDHRPPERKAIEAGGSRCYDAGKNINGQAPCALRVGAVLAQLLHIARRYA